MRSWMVAFLGGWFTVLMTGHYWSPALLATSISLHHLIAGITCLAALFLVIRYPAYFGFWSSRCGKFIQFWPVPGFFIVGFLLATFVLRNAVFVLPPQLNGADIEVSGFICNSPPSIAVRNENNQLVQVVSFCVTKVYKPSSVPVISENIMADITANPLKLSCYYCDIKLHQNYLYRLRIKVKFKRPLLNFHNTWSWQKQWRLPWIARGSIRKVITQQALSQAETGVSVAPDTIGISAPFAAFQKIVPAIKQWPQQYRANSIQKIVNLRHGSSISALIFGDRSGLTTDDWQRLGNAGLTHLLVISGLHIGYIVVVLLFLSRFALRYTTRRWQLYVSLLVVFTALVFYLAVIDYGIPAVRASIVAVFALLLGIYRARLLPSTWLLSALLICSLLDPFAFVSKGFWLSFLGVGILLMLFSHRPWQKQTRLPGLWRVQVGFLLGLAGVLLWSFEQIPAAAVINNMLAVPLVSLLLPLALLATLANLVCEPLAVFLFGLTDHLFTLFWRVIDFGNLIPPVAFEHSSAVFALLLMILAIPCLIHFRLPYAAGLILVIVLAVRFGLKKPGQPFSMLLLDVGQGSALVLQTEGDSAIEPVTFLYDAGPAYTNWNAGERVVVPALEDKQVRQLRTVVISHDDKDHSGGLGAVLENYPETKLVSGQADRMQGAEQCSPGSLAMVEGLKIRFIWPVSALENFLSPAEAEADNNHSCVIKLIYRNVSILLTGDIEAAAQQAILDMLRQQNDLEALQADILLLPHHGSKNAFNPNFLAKVKPQIVVVSAGHNNAYGHPHRRFREWFRNRNVAFFNTGEQGAIEITLAESSTFRDRMSSFVAASVVEPPEVVELRVRTARQPWFWQHFSLSGPDAEVTEVSRAVSAATIEQAAPQ